MRPSSPSIWLALSGLLLLLNAVPARAADGGTDAGVSSLPDGGSVGEGGADQNQQEGDDTTGQVATACRDSRDCSKGFGCSGTRCIYIGYREASGGCLLGVDASAGAVLGAFFLGARGLRRRRR